MTPPQTDGPGNALYFGVPLRQRIVVPVLGVPVTIESNSAIALEIAEEAFGIWRRLRGWGSRSGGGRSGR